MRVTSANAFETSISNLQRRQQALSEGQDQLTSGKRVIRPSDDPTAAAAAERARAASSRVEAEKRALSASRNAMQLTESALGNANELMTQARELIVSAGNGSYTDAERKGIAEQLRGLRNDLLNIANRTDGAGRYLFGGQGSDAQPLQDTPTGVVFAGTNGQALAGAGEVTPLSNDGQSVWLRAPDPAHPGSTVSVFDTLDAAINDLQTPGRTGTQVTQTVSTALSGLDAADGNLSAWRARAGDALNRIDAIGARLDQSNVDAKRQLSEAEDLDMLQAISDFQNRQSGYDAALKTYSIVQHMSLFEYLR